jgi:hypothetical protein
VLASGTADFLVLANAERGSQAVGCGGGFWEHLGGVNVRWVDGVGFGPWRWLSRLCGWRSRAGWLRTGSWSCFGDGCGLNLGRIIFGTSGVEGMRDAGGLEAVAGS